MNSIIKLIVICNYVVYSYSYSVDCDNNGYCKIKYDDVNTPVAIQPGYLPSIPQKNIKPFKSPSINDNINNPQQQILHRPKSTGFSINGKLPDSDLYVCAGGLGECINSCCNNGLCSDPFYFCYIQENTVKLIILIVGLLFVILIIIYWVFYYLVGVWYNAQNNFDAKTDLFYTRQFTEGHRHGQVQGSNNNNTGSERLPPGKKISDPNSRTISQSSIYSKPENEEDIVPYKRNETTTHHKLINNTNIIKKLQGSNNLKTDYNEGIPDNAVDKNNKNNFQPYFITDQNLRKNNFNKKKSLSLNLKGNLDDRKKNNLAEKIENNFEEKVLDM
jgi:hypothetical protein